jgi:hypothetical protein
MVKGDAIQSLLIHTTSPTISVPLVVYYCAIGTLKIFITSSDPDYIYKHLVIITQLQKRISRSHGLLICAMIFNNVSQEKPEVPYQPLRQSWPRKGIS